MAEGGSKSSGSYGLVSLAFVRSQLYVVDDSLRGHHLLAGKQQLRQQNLGHGLYHHANACRGDSLGLFSSRLGDDVSRGLHGDLQALRDFVELVCTRIEV